MIFDVCAKHHLMILHVHKDELGGIGEAKVTNDFVERNAARQRNFGEIAQVDIVSKVSKIFLDGAA